MLDILVDDLNFGAIKVTDANGETKNFNLVDELKINEFNVREEFLKQPAKYAYWTGLLEQLRLYQESWELKAERRKAELYDPCRIALIAKGAPKPSKDAIEAEILLDEPYMALRSNVNAMAYNVRQLQYVVKALEQRKDMLIQYGADKRREYEYSRKISMPAEEPPQYQNPSQYPPQ